MYHNRHILNNKKTKPVQDLPFVQYKKASKDSHLLKTNHLNLKLNDELLNSNRLLADLIGEINKSDLY